jgi:hypothetical protein
MDEVLDLRKKLAVSALRIALLERGLDPVYVAGLLTKSAIIERLAIGDDGKPAADIARVAHAIVTELPLKAQRESAEEWAERVSGVDKYLERYVPPSQLKSRGL